jgi:hypothetical protein
MASISSSGCRGALAALSRSVSASALIVSRSVSSVLTFAERATTSGPLSGGGSASARAAACSATSASVAARSAVRELLFVRHFPLAIMDRLALDCRGQAAAEREQGRRGRGLDCDYGVRLYSYVCQPPPSHRRWMNRSQSLSIAALSPTRRSQGGSAAGRRAASCGPTRRRRRGPASARTARGSGRRGGSRFALPKCFVFERWLWLLAVQHAREQRRVHRVGYQLAEYAPQLFRLQTAVIPPATRAAARL